MTIDYQVLREAAEKATPDEWVAFISTDTGTYAVHTPGDERCEDVIKWTGFDGQKMQRTTLVMLPRSTQRLHWSCLVKLSAWRTQILMPRAEFQSLRLISLRWWQRTLG